MTKKDRVAIVISILYSMWLFAFAASESGWPVILAVFGAPLVIYWGYRFIKDDISFLKTEKDT